MTSRVYIYVIIVKNIWLICQEGIIRALRKVCLLREEAEYEREYQFNHVDGA